MLDHIISVYYFLRNLLIPQTILEGLLTGALQWSQIEP